MAFVWPTVADMDRFSPRSLVLVARVVAISATFAALPPGAAIAASGWTWPVRGEVQTPYRNGSDPYARGQHRGIDVTAPAGTAVVAAAGGRVRFAGPLGASGLTVSVRTADGRFDTAYLHLGAISVRKGQRVGAGDRIGAVGTSGRGSIAAAHLHFGVRDAGKRHAYRDPLALLPPPLPPGRDAPRAVPLPVEAPVRVAPAPGPVRVIRPERRPVRVRVPAARRLPQPQLPPLPLARPLRAPQPSPNGPEARRPRPAPHLGPAPRPVPADLVRSPPPVFPEARIEPGPSRRAGDVGWALACAGLLVAAVLMGGARRPGGAGKRAGGWVVEHLRPLLGGR